MADDAGVGSRHGQGSGKRQAGDAPALEHDRLVDALSHRRRARGHLGRYLKCHDLAAHDAGGTFVNIAEALARGSEEADACRRALQFAQARSDAAAEQARAIARSLARRRDEARLAAVEDQVNARRRRL